jgi:hypothetical protein
MNGANLDFEDAESFGDVQQAKRDNILCVGFQNIHNLPEDCRTSKSRQLVDYVVQKDYDCFMMAEICLNWTKISANERWFERISGKFRTSRSVFAHNVTELHQSEVLQPGGVGLCLLMTLLIVSRLPVRIQQAWVVGAGPNFKKEMGSKSGRSVCTGPARRRAQLQLTSNSLASCDTTLQNSSPEQHSTKTFSWNARNGLMRVIN